MKKGSARRELMKGLGLASLGLAISPRPGVEGRVEKGSEHSIYVGTYTSAGSRGIHLLRFDPVTGRLRLEGLAAEAVNPSYLAIAPGGRHLCAVNEVGTLNGQPVGGLSTFAVSSRDGKLRQINQVGSGGASPCYVTFDPVGRHILAANYSGGNLIVVPMGRDGLLGEASHLVQHQGSGGNPQRQAGPRAHCVVFTPERRHVVAVDLGIDKVMIYRWEARQGRLVPNSPGEFRTRPGAGPRHIDFHPQGRLAAVINELDSTLISCAWDGAKGELKEIQTVSTLPAAFAGTNCADVHFHPSGRFVYGSNRGHDSIAIWRIDARTGRLELVGHESTGGRNPRNFVIDPTGRWLLAANQASDSIIVFRIDQTTGALTRTGDPVTISMPVCLKFL
jgi:6-phosphogluconolactonase